VQHSPAAVDFVGVRDRKSESDVLPPGATLTGVLPPRPRLAVVGSRAAHARFRDAVPVVLAAMREEGWSLVSGGALGIDGDAHRAALAADVPQVVVLPCGADRVYPPAHADLFAAIAATSTGALLHALPAGTPTSRAMFVSRNRHVVALADAVLVVEAARRSGTASTGTLALRRALPVAALVGSPGAAQLIDAGATSLAFDAASPRAFTAAVVAWLRGRPVGLPWPSSLHPLREVLTGGPPEGVSTADLHAAGLALALLEAQLSGLVVEVAPGRWRATSA
jgi:DNA processing protein